MIVHTKIIRGHPTFDFSRLRARSSRLPDPMNESNTFFYGYARIALLEGLKLLSINRGDNILVPSYICSDVLQPIKYSGIMIKYYVVDEKLNPSVPDIENNIDNKTKAILAVNYFGFPTSIVEIANICRKRSLYFIEDNAHGLFSRSNHGVLGSFGDISIFSMRKTVGIPNGAALVINNRSLNNIIQNKPAMGVSEMRYLLSSLNLCIEDMTGINPAKIIKNIIIGEKTTSKHLLRMNNVSNIEAYYQHYSKITDYVMKRIHIDRCVITRREAYKYWSEHLSEGEPLYDELPDGVSPYVYPLKIRNRDRFMRRFARKDGTLLSNGIKVEVFPWPSLPGDLGNVPAYYNEIVCFPIWRNIGR